MFIGNIYVWVGESEEEDEWEYERERELFLSFDWQTFICKSTLHTKDINPHVCTENLFLTRKS